LLPSKSKQSTELPSSVYINESKITNKQTILDEFNNFFSTIGENLVKEIDSNNHTFKKFLFDNINSSFYMEPPRQAEVTNLINSLNLHKAVG